MSGTTTVLVPFLPSLTGSVQFQVTLDGGTYNVTVTWNVYRQNYYVIITDTSGNIIVTLPRIGSPPGYNINIVGGYFTSTLVWRPEFQQFEVTP